MPQEVIDPIKLVAHRQRRETTSNHEELAGTAMLLSGIPTQSGAHPVLVTRSKGSVTACSLPEMTWLFSEPESDA